MSDYRGPLEGDGIADFILEDSKVCAQFFSCYLLYPSYICVLPPFILLVQPSVQLISSVKEIGEIMQNNLNTIIFSLFNEEDLVDDESTEGYSIDAWGQYQAAADSLRG